MTTQTTLPEISQAHSGAAARARAVAAPEFEPASAGRRGFMKAAGGLFIAFSLPSMAAIAAAGPAAHDAEAVPPPDAGRLYAWLAVHPDNTATLYTGKVDVGTGIEIALAQIAAEELDFPLERLHVVMGTTSHTVDQGPSYGSRTVRYAGPQIRHAAAAGRQALLELAATHFGTQAGQLVVHDGIVSVKGQAGKSISYGALVAGKRLDMEIGASGKTFDMKVAPDAVLKNPSTYTVVGRPAARKDIPGKVTGAFTYIQDVRVEGMLHGRVVRPYGVGAKLLDVDESGLKDIPGFVQIVRRGNFLGVVAQTEEAAIRAADKLGSRLHAAGPSAGQAKWSDWHDLPQQPHIWDTLRETQGGDIQVATQGSVDAALGSAPKKLKATYETPFQMHGSIGPSCAIADVGKENKYLADGTVDRLGASFWDAGVEWSNTLNDFKVLVGHRFYGRSYQLSWTRTAALLTTSASYVERPTDINQQLLGQGVDAIPSIGLPGIPALREQRVYLMKRATASAAYEMPIGMLRVTLYDERRIYFLLNSAQERVANAHVSWLFNIGALTTLTPTYGWQRYRYQDGQTNYSQYAQLELVHQLDPKDFASLRLRRDSRNVHAASSGARGYRANVIFLQLTHLF